MRRAVLINHMKIPFCIKMRFISRKSYLIPDMYVSISICHSASYNKLHSDCILIYRVRDMFFLSFALKSLSADEVGVGPRKHSQDYTIELNNGSSRQSNISDAVSLGDVDDSISLAPSLGVSPNPSRMSSATKSLRSSASRASSHVQNDHSESSAPLLKQPNVTNIINKLIKSPALSSSTSHHSKGMNTNRIQTRNYDIGSI